MAFSKEPGLRLLLPKTVGSSIGVTANATAMTARRLSTRTEASSIGF